MSDKKVESIFISEGEKCSKKLCMKGKACKKGYTAVSGKYCDKGMSCCTKGTHINRTRNMWVLTSRPSLDTKHECPVPTLLNSIANLCGISCESLVTYIWINYSTV